MNYKIKKVEIRYATDRRGEPMGSHMKLYIHSTNEAKETVGQSLINRRRRPYQDYKEFVIPQLMERFKKDEKTKEIANQTWIWRQKCGCTCACSPGFIGSKFGFLDIYVEVKPIP